LEKIWMGMNLNCFKDKGIDVLMNAETDVEGMGHVRAAYMQSAPVASFLS